MIESIDFLPQKLYFAKKREDRRRNAKKREKNRNCLLLNYTSYRLAEKTNKKLQG